MPSANKFLVGLGKSAILKLAGLDDNVRDYQHASRTFRPGPYALHPRFKHLFHVVFNFAPVGTRVFENYEKEELSLMVKSASLPNFSIDIDDQNQYNKHTYTQTRINYEPVTITFHDDNSDISRRLWFAYYNHFYSDPCNDRNLDGDKRNIYRKRNDNFDQAWGYKGQEPFFRDIRVFSMLQKRFAEYRLMNPIIESFNHDTHAYVDGGLMENTMTIRFDSVIYLTGTVPGQGMSTFAGLHYDHLPSPLSSTTIARGLYTVGRGLLDVFGDADQNLKEIVAAKQLKNASSINFYTNVSDTLGKIFSPIAQPFKDPDSLPLIPPGSSSGTIFPSSSIIPKTGNDASVSPNTTNDPVFAMTGSPFKSGLSKKLITSEGVSLTNDKFRGIDSVVKTDIDIGGSKTEISGTFTVGDPMKMSSTKLVGGNSLISSNKTGIIPVLEQIQRRINEDEKALIDDPDNIKIQERIDYNKERFASLLRRTTAIKRTF